LLYSSESKPGKYAPDFKMEIPSSSGQFPNLGWPLSDK